MFCCLVAAAIVELHHGKLTVNSAGSEGGRMYSLMIPLFDPPQEEVTVIARNDSGPANPAASHIHNNGQSPAPVPVPVHQTPHNTRPKSPYHGLRSSFGISVVGSGNRGTRRIAVSDDVALPIPATVRKADSDAEPSTNHGIVRVEKDRDRDTAKDKLKETAKDRGLDGSSVSSRSKHSRHSSPLELDIGMENIRSLSHHMMNIRSCPSNESVGTVSTSPVSALVRSTDNRNQNTAFDFSGGDGRRGSGCEGGSRKLRMLLVDDQPANRKMMCRMLRWLCDSCDECGDRNEAIDFVRRAINQQRAPDVILCNHQLPGLDGAALFRDLRGGTVGFRGVLIGLVGGGTGNSLSDDTTRLQQQGASRVMKRPLDFHKLETELSGK